MPRRETYRQEAPGEKAGGFTLIELLVVIAIIAMLMAAMLPVLNGARKRARAVVCRVHLKQWGTTLALYLEDREGRLARAGNPITPGLSFLRGVCLDWLADPNDRERAHAVETRGISCCPMATRTSGIPEIKSVRQGVGPTGTYLEIRPGGVFLAWEITLPTPAFRGSYGINRNLFGPSLFTGSDILAGGSERELNVYALKRCNTIPALLDGVGFNCWMLRADESAPPAGTLRRSPFFVLAFRHVHHRPVQQPAQRNPQHPVSGLVGPTRRTQGDVDAEVAWQIRYPGSLDQGRRGSAGRVAPVDAKAQRLLVV